MIDRVRIANAALYAVAVAIFVATATFLYLMAAPVSVLKDWHIVSPTGNYRIGDTVIIQSLFTKLKPVDGVSHRKLLCTNAKNAEVAYPVNDAIANHRAQKKAGVGIPVTIPIMVVPAKCKLAISIEYRVYPFRTVTEYGTSNSFNVVE